MKKLATTFDVFAILTGCAGIIVAITYGILAKSFWIALGCGSVTVLAVLWLVATSYILSSLEKLSGKLDALNDKIQTAQDAGVQPLGKDVENAVRMGDYEQITCKKCGAVQRADRSVCFECGAALKV